MPTLSRRRMLGLLATGGVGLVGVGASSVALSDFAFAGRSDRSALRTGASPSSSAASSSTSSSTSTTTTRSSEASTHEPSGTEWNHRLPHVVVLGDSITYFSGGAILAALDGKANVSLVGRIGYTIEQVMPDARILALTHPEIVVINLGTNDAFKAVPTADSITQLDDMLGMYASSKRVLVDISTHFGDASCAARAQAFDDHIASLGLPVVDWNAAVADELAAGTPITSDTIHPNDAGQKILADLIAHALAL
jgi:lysophospholipase L1-like esterase